MVPLLAPLQTGDAANARALWAKTKDPDITSIHMPAKMVAERSLVSVHCTVYCTVFCTVCYTVFCTVCCSVYCTVFCTVHCLYSVLYTVLQSALDITSIHVPTRMVAERSLVSVHCTVDCTVFCT